MPLPKIAWISILAAAALSPLLATPAQAQGAQIQHVAVLKSGAATEIEIATSKRLVPMTQVVTDPDRLVIDFPDARPGPTLRAITVSRGEVKSVRASLFSADPPMTRVVVELNSAQEFELIPSSKSVILKITGPVSAAAAAPPAAAPVSVPVASAPPVARLKPLPSPAPKAPEPRTPEPPNTEVTTAEVRPPESRAPEAKLAEPKMLEPKVPEPKTPELKTRDSVAVASIPQPEPVRPAVTRASETVHMSPPLAALPPGSLAQVRRVAVLKSGGATEIEIEASERIVPEVQVVTGPDRLVIDFPRATPGPQLRAVAVNQGEVKGVRVGLLSAKPPVTRVVLDLKSPQAYQLFPLGKSVIVKLGGVVGVAAAPAPGLTPQSTAAAIEPAKRFEVSFQDGMLSVLSTKGSLAELLNEIHRQTGADIAIPAGAEQEAVAASLGPGTPRDVVSRLLDGSRYNFILVGADNDPNKLERVILSPKGAGEIVVQETSPRPDPVPVAQMQGPDRSVAPAPAAAPPPPPETQPQGDSMPPEVPPQPGDPEPAPN